MALHVLVRYIDPSLPPINKIEKGDWIDLRASRIVVNGYAVDWTVPEQGEDYIEYRQGDELRIYLGFALQMPEGYEAHVLPRGSTFKNFGLIQTNSKGIVDNSFRGNDDQWFVPMAAFRDGRIERYDRCCQFRFVKKMEEVEFEPVEFFEDAKNRGSLGSTGVK